MTVLSALTSFLSEPDPEDPLDPEIARIYKEDIEQFKKTAALWTKNVCEQSRSLMVSNIPPDMKNSLITQSLVDLMLVCMF